MTIKLLTFPRAALLAGLLTLAACNSGQGPDPSDDATGNADQSMLGGVVDNAMDKARTEMRNSNISISQNTAGLAKAEITPKGVLLIDGRKITTTPEQEAMLIDYRTHLMGVAESGMDIGAQGADLAGKAMGEAAKGIFTGKSEAEIEETMEAEAAQIKAAAAQLCDRLPALLASEQRLAASLPEFAPYATMGEGDIDDCMDEDSDSLSDAERARRREEVRGDIRKGIRKGIRGSIQKVVQSTGLASRDDAENTEAKPDDTAAGN